MDGLDRIDVIQILPEDEKDSSRYLYDEDLDEGSSFNLTTLCTFWIAVLKHLNPFKAVFDDIETGRTDRRIIRPNSSSFVELKETFFDKTPTSTLSNNISVNRSDGPTLITTVKADIHTEHEHHTNSPVAAQDTARFSKNKYKIFSPSPIQN